MKLLLPTRAHSDLSWLRPTSKNIQMAFKPQLFEHLFSHQVALFVLLFVNHIQKISLQQNYINHFAFMV